MIIEYLPDIEFLRCIGKIYMRSLSKLKFLKPDLADSTYHWAISGLVREGQIVRLGYDAYSRPDSSTKKEYDPLYSDLALEVMNQIEQMYPYVTFTVFETVMMNDFLNHLIVQNTIFIQVEKESSIYIFRFLQEKGYQNVMYKPGEKEFDLY